jgi:hypothetical protein
MEPSSIKLKWPSGLDNTFYIMKENELIQMKNKVVAMTNTMSRLIEDFIKLDQLARGTLTAFQLHIGKEEWEKVVKQLQEKEQESKQPEEKKLEL